MDVDVRKMVVGGSDMQASEDVGDSGLDHGRSSQSWGPTVEVHHRRRPGRGRRALPGRVPRGRRQVRGDRAE